MTAARGRLAAAEIAVARATAARDKLALTEPRTTAEIRARSPQIVAAERQRIEAQDQRSAAQREVDAAAKVYADRLRDLDAPAERSTPAAPIGFAAPHAGP
jgi:hypothetical protein